MDVYPPREDTQLILEALREIVKPGMKVLDMGTGSGILGLAAKDLGAEVLAVDINPKAVETAREQGLNTIESDLFENVQGKFDLIVFNPPYLELDEIEKRGEQIELALNGGKRGREVLDRFLSNSPKHLASGGKLLFLQAEFNGIKETESILKQLNFNFKIVKKRYVGLEGNLLVFLAWRS